MGNESINSNILTPRLKESEDDKKMMDVIKLPRFVHPGLEYVSLGAFFVGASLEVVGRNQAANACQTHQPQHDKSVLGHV
jgi:hypothetical protein